MNRWSDLTLGDVFRGVVRYRPYLLTIVAVAVIAVLAPGEAPPREVSIGAGSARDDSGAVESYEASPEGVAAEAGAAGDAATGTTGLSAGGSGTTGGTGAGGTRAGTSSRAPAASISGNPMLAPDCDTTTGRMKFPSKFSPPCIAPFTGDNGGATHRGVTKDTITIAMRFNPDANPAVEAALFAAGAGDTRDEVRATRQAWIDMFTAHYRTYGRKVKLVYFEQSGSDEAAGRADALKVATEIKAFAAWSGSGTYREELARRGVVCICGGRDVKYFNDMAPYLWGTQPAYEQWLGPAGEYIGKRLWGRKAVHAGDAVYQTQQRKLGLVYSESSTAPVAVKGAEFMERELGKYGAKFAEKISYTGDINSAQEQARVIVAKLKDSGITTVAFWGDFLAPLFMTQEATRQQYFPEWIITGGNLVDTTFWARAYDQQQWSHAFGVSQLWARGPQAESEAYFQHVWHHGGPPAAKAQYEVWYQEPWMFMTGVHMAGPKLTPQTFRDGLFAFPPSGGGPTLPKRSFGRHGIWPFDDYTAFDDITEIWYDPNAFGTNEVGQQGKGMLRYVDGGKRLLYGQWPTTDPKVFQIPGSVTQYDQLPASDRFTKYEHKHYQ